MSAIGDLIEGLFHLTVMGATYKAGQDAQNSFAEASERDDFLGMLVSAIAYGVSTYGFLWSARSLNRLIRKQRGLATLSLWGSMSGKNPRWYLPK